MGGNFLIGIRIETEWDQIKINLDTNVSEAEFGRSKTNSGDSGNMYVISE